MGFDKNDKIIKNDRFFRLMADNLPDMLWAKDIEGRYLFANRALCENLLMAKDTQEPIGKQDIFFAERERRKHPENQEWHTFGELCFNTDLITLEHMKPMRFEEYGNVKGKMLYLEVHKAPLFDEQGKLLGTVGSARDITRQKELERQIKKSNETFEQLLNATIEGLFVFDSERRCIQVNEMAAKITGYSQKELIGKHALDDLVAPESFDIVKEKIRLDSAEPYEMIVMRRDGSRVPVIARGKNLELFGKRVRISAIMDITEMKEAQTKIEYLAYYDVLTGLPNRRLLTRYLEQAMHFSARNGNYGALIFMDLDNFKKINDTAGHDSGDRLLKEIATRIKDSIRRSDTVSRFGGDEFVILLTNLKGTAEKVGLEVEKWAENIRSKVEEQFWLPEPMKMKIHPECSMGITLFKGDVRTTDELLKHADIALYEAKNSGRNCIRFYNRKMQQNVDKQIETEHQLNEAFSRNEIEVHYQPQLSMQGKIKAAEALCRWNHPVKGLITPDQFIPVAEMSGQIIKLGDIMLEKVCNRLKIWSGIEGFNNLAISLNISVKQFMSPSFVQSVEEKIEKYGVRPHMLKLELTESLFLDNFDKVVKKMNRLKKIGIEISLDDFGTGFSSLSYLKKLPLTQLKIDRSFIRDIIEDDNDKAIVRATIAIAESMGLETVAEGVETAEQKELLEDMGCKIYQGYLFSKPLPLEEFEAYAADKL
ncbi:sensor domain-containing protein [Hydrogenimonas cancrithermarum]|uniref:Phosphodiesterase n=1 Tax=Hydrogenimonas cancrithermarum TaxID=2993563 RepID=A0ABM8FN34_9BACT|nr:bifunctional diguanylate cyclase/phosphodiesterase [Hydrogenimonas cancrithermarum]BDY13822.1 phosphodiesterase [Hydrogenimonas cancrithermarum]